MTSRPAPRLIHRRGMSRTCSEVLPLPAGLGWAYWRQAEAGTGAPVNAHKSLEKKKTYRDLPTRSSINIRSDGIHRFFIACSITASVIAQMTSFLAQELIDFLMNIHMAFQPGVGINILRKKNETYILI